MFFLRQSTAATVLVGPFVSPLDAVTERTALSSQTGRVGKNGTGAALTPSSWTHDANGNYAVGLSTSHTDTVGRLRVSFQDSATYLPVWGDFHVLSAAVYDWLFGTVAPSTHAASAVWDELKSAHTVSGSFGAYLDAAISSRLATTGYTAPSTPPTAAAIRAEMDSNSTKLANLTGPVALASQIPANFTTALFVSPGVFSAGALANAPTGGGSGLDAAATRAALGLATANLDTQLGGIKTRTDLIPDIAVSGTVSGTPTTTSIVGAAGLSATNDLYNGMFLVFTSGTLKGIGMEVTDYVGSSRTFTTDAFPVAAANGDTFVLVGRKDA